MSTVQDTVETVLTLTGLNVVQRGMGDAGAAVLKYGGAVTDVQRQTIDFGIAAALTGVGLKFLGDSAKAAADDQANLTRASGNFKGAFPQDELEAWTDHLRILTGVSDDTTFGMLGLLGTFQITKAQAQALSLPILNAAEALKAQGVSAEQLAVQLGKAYQTGNASALRRVGIILDQTAFSAADAEGRVRLLADALQKQGGDAAINFRTTMQGAQQAAASGWQEVQEAIGDSLTGPLTSAFNAIAKVEEGFLALPAPVKSTAGTIAIVLVGAMAAYTIGTGIAFFQTIRMAQELAKLELQARRTAAAVNTVGSPTGNVPGAAAAGGGGKGGILGGILASVGVAAAEAAAQAGKNEGGVAGGAKFTFGRAAEGAIIGGQFGGAPGALIGGILGSLEAAIETTVDAVTGKKKTGATDSPELAESKKQTELLQKQLAALQANNSAGTGFSPKDIPIMVQRATSRATRV